MAARRRRETAEVSRARILAAAGRRFGALGFDRTRLEDVAADVGIGRAGVLYHFGTKRELYEAVADELFGGLYRRLLRDLQSPAPYAERVERTVHTLIDYMVERPEAAQIALRAAATADPDEEKQARERSEPFERLIVSAFEAAVPDADPTDALLLTSAVAGTTLYYVAGLPTFAGPPSRDPLAPERVARLKQLVSGIAASAMRGWSQD
ncbi:MAG: TetR/AcrR family transcriptional regulator [Myxococcota bacterium]|nr:TetR/AcrR family transcriptional regulator [Myxococcota bacterium]